MISEVVPQRKMFMFFALFNTISRTSGFIGPVLASIIIERAGGNVNAAFWLLSAAGLFGAYVLWCVNTALAEADCAECEWLRSIALRMIASAMRKEDLVAEAAQPNEYSRLFQT